MSFWNSIKSAFRWTTPRISVKRGRGRKRVGMARKFPRFGTVAKTPVYGNVRATSVMQSVPRAPTNVVVSPGPLTLMVEGNKKPMFGNEPGILASSESSHDAVSAPAAPMSGIFDEEKDVLFRWGVIIGLGYLFFTKTKRGRAITEKVVG